MRPALIVAALLAASPLPAAAHAILLDSQPASGATVPPGPTHVVLRFNSRIDQGRSRLELRGGDGKPTPLRLAPSGPDTLQSDATLAPGAWTLRWQVLAIDGHITRGDLPFSVAAP